MGLSDVTAPVTNLLGSLGLNNLLNNLPIVNSLPLGPTVDSLPVVGGLAQSLGLDSLLPKGNGGAHNNPLQSLTSLIDTVQSTAGGILPLGNLDPQSLLQGLQSGALTPSQITQLLGPVTGMATQALGNTSLGGLTSALQNLSPSQLQALLQSTSKVLPVDTNNLTDPLAKLQSAVQASASGGLDSNQLAALLSTLQSSSAGTLAQTVQSNVPSTPVDGLTSDQLSALLRTLQSTASKASPADINSQIGSIVQPTPIDPTSQTAKLQALLQALGQSTLSQVGTKALTLPSPADDSTAALAAILQDVQKKGNTFNLEKANPVQDFNPSMSLPLPVPTSALSMSSQIDQITDSTSTLPVPSVSSLLNSAKAKLPLPLANMMSSAPPFTKSSKAPVALANKALPVDTPLLSSGSSMGKMPFSISTSLKSSTIASKTPLNRAQLEPPLISSLPVPSAPLTDVPVSAHSTGKDKVPIADQMAVLDPIALSPAPTPTVALTQVAGTLKSQLPNLPAETASINKISTPSLFPRHHKHRVEYDPKEYEVLDLGLDI